MKKAAMLFPWSKNVEMGVYWEITLFEHSVLTYNKHLKHFRKKCRNISPPPNEIKMNETLFVSLNVETVLFCSFLNLHNGYFQNLCNLQDKIQDTKFKRQWYPLIHLYGISKEDDHIYIVVSWYMFILSLIHCAMIGKQMQFFFKI